MISYIFALICAAGISCCFVGIISHYHGLHWWGVALGIIPFIATVLAVFLPNREEKPGRKDEVRS